ncbi:MAG: putative metal-binding motif-containing protein, partial [Myxococcales bacterium]|nr:putative metal-binding motif-containing protein [Myxococcales bacterium]
MRLPFLRSLILLAPLVAVVSCDSTTGNTNKAGTDGGSGTIDSGKEDASTPCQADDDCDDGLYCTGEETCDAGTCKAGTPVFCDDGIDCTVDTCSEASRKCVSGAPDLDGDGHGDATCTDGEGALGDDCDDGDANRFPGNVEVCDEMNHDEDCDTSTFGKVDGDDDGYFSAACCNETDENTLNCGQDCDDVRAQVNPDATEACDGKDNDCDGDTDEEVAILLYPDADRDGHGAEGSTGVLKCAGAVGFSNLDDDCNDDPTMGGANQHPTQL